MVAPGVPHHVTQRGNRRQQVFFGDDDYIAYRALAAALGEAHRRYSREVNFREGWRGYLWQGRFASFPMDEPYVLTGARYIELNPVRAGLVGRARD